MTSMFKLAFSTCYYSPNLDLAIPGRLRLSQCCRSSARRDEQQQRPQQGTSKETTMNPSMDHSPPLHEEATEQEQEGCDEEEGDESSYGTSFLKTRASNRRLVHGSCVGAKSSCSQHPLQRYGGCILVFSQDELKQFKTVTKMGAHNRWRPRQKSKSWTCFFHSPKKANLKKANLKKAN